VNNFGTQHINSLIVSPPEHVKHVHAKEASDDVPIVMTHGFGSGLAMFYRNLEDLSTRSGRRVYAVDWLGMGRSSRADYPARLTSKITHE
jgi:cardiolipin-specific phospholipase